MRPIRQAGGLVLRALDSWWLDARLGIRMLVKYPGLALAGVFGIAVAVAIATGGFSVVYSNFQASSLPLDEGDRLVSIEMLDLGTGRAERRVLHDYRLWRESLASVGEVSAFRTVTPNLIAPGAEPESIQVAAMSASGFRAARVRPLLGRYLEDTDETEGAAPVVVIGERVWRARFAADPGILGRTIQLGTIPYSVVGVMPEGFAFPVNHRFWIALRAGTPPAQPLAGPELMVFGRLAPGATLRSAQTELASIGARIASDFPKLYSNLRPQVMPYAHPFLGMHRAEDINGLHMMNGLVTMLLILVSMNVAILVYTRTALRETEIATRMALGASRARIVAQLFAEGLVLSVTGAGAGVAIAWLALRQVGASTGHIAAELPFWVSFRLAPAAVLYAGVLSVLAAAIVGIAPALKATQGWQAGARVIGTGGRAGLGLGKTWTVLIVAQVACAVALLPGAAFNAWKTIQAGVAGPGFAAEEFVCAELGMDDSPRGDYGSRHTELMRRLEGDSQVSAVTFALALPGNERGTMIETENTALAVRVNRVAVNFFQAFEVPILAGRGFDASDAAEGAPVLVNQSLAERVFGGDALGRRIRYARGADQNAPPGRWYEIAGVVRDFPAGVSPGMEDAPLKLYHAIAPGRVQPVNLVVRVRGGDASAFGRRLPSIAAGVNPDVYLRRIMRLDEFLRSEQWIRRLEASLLTAVSVTVLLLSSAGIYALMSFTVSQRRKEIGIRMALGADRRRIVASIFSRAMGQLAAGAALGAAASAVAQRASGGEMMRDEALTVLPAVALLMVAVGLLAALGPARRSLRVEPVEALREQ